MTTDDLPTISVVKKWDSGEIMALYQAGGWWKEEYDPEELPRLISGSFAFAVASERNSGRAVGMGRVISDGVSDAYIQDLVVLPGYRGSGLGAKIVSCLVDQCKKEGISWIALIAEPGSEQFYQRLGFGRMEGHIPLIYKGASR